MGVGSNLKSPAALALKKTISLWVHDLKLDFDFYYLAIKILDGVFFQQNMLTLIWPSG